MDELIRQVKQLPREELLRLSAVLLELDRGLSSPSAALAQLLPPPISSASASSLPPPPPPPPPLISVKQIHPQNVLPKEHNPQQQQCMSPRGPMQTAEVPRALRPKALPNQSIRLRHLQWARVPTTVAMKEGNVWLGMDEVDGQLSEWRGGGVGNKADLWDKKSTWKIR